MSITWPVALIIVTVIAALTAFITIMATSGMRMEREKTNADRADDYKKIIDDFAALSSDLKAGQASIAADVADMRIKVDSVERMIREVD
jgi:hypothetical protein